MRHFLTLAFILTFSTALVGQVVIVGHKEVPSSKLKSWVVSNAKQYEGTYHFGESELESNFNLAVDSGLITAQIQSGMWAKSPERWKKVYRTLTNIQISGNKFHSTEVNGEFVTLLDDGKKSFGLKIYKSWSFAPSAGRREVGLRITSIATYYDGIYPAASYRVLTKAALNNYSKEQLTLMRNEIFARYGFQFASPILAAYFRKQKWYQPEQVEIDKLLTVIERRNITTLKSLETN